MAGPAVVPPADGTPQNRKRGRAKKVNSAGDEETPSPVVDEAKHTFWDNYQDKTGFKRHSWMSFDFSPVKHDTDKCRPTNRAELKANWELKDSAKVNGAKIIKTLSAASGTNQFIVPYLEFRSAKELNTWMATEGTSPTTDDTQPEFHYFLDMKRLYFQLINTLLYSLIFDLPFTQACVNYSCCSHII